jgi:hypothetical protein
MMNFSDGVFAVRRLFAQLIAAAGRTQKMDVIAGAAQSHQDFNKLRNPCIIAVDLNRSALVLDLEAQHAQPCHR